MEYTQEDDHPTPVHRHWLSRNRLLAANAAFTFRERGPGMSHRRRPRWDPERVIRLTVTVVNAAASLIDALHRFR